MDGGMDGWMDELMDGWIDGQVYEQRNGWMDEQMDGQVDGEMSNVRLGKFAIPCGDIDFHTYDRPKLIIFIIIYVEKLCHLNDQ